MILKDTEFGAVELSNIPIPENLSADISGTYTFSGRVLVSVQEQEKGNDRYRVFTMEDSGEDICEIYDGLIPKKQGANGIRWMCFSDNRRILLGDYVLECEPDLDHCVRSSLLPVRLPPEVSRIPGLFMRWSEPIISPDGEHICFTSLTGSGAYNFLGNLVRTEEGYEVQGARVISTVQLYYPDEGNPGWSRIRLQRGGEVKQFVRGGRGIALAGEGRSLCESCLQMLDSEEFLHITSTLGYEETAILSPDERLAVCMSPRFSPQTDMGVLGVIPLSGDMLTRSRCLNVLYQYAIAGARFGRKGNIGPALIDVEKSMRDGRGYQGVNLSDRENRWVYYSPMSWHPDSTRAMWLEKTRIAEGPLQARLRRCRLIDRAPSSPVPAGRTPDGEEVPYALPAEAVLSAVQPEFPVRVKGITGTVVTSVDGEGRSETRYEHYSEDGKTFYDGYLSVKSPANMFTPGETVIREDITVTGEHTGRADLRLTLQGDARFQIHPDRTAGSDGLPKSYGFAEYDGVRREVNDMLD